MVSRTLDLIPTDYREERRARRLLTWFFPIFGLLVVGLGTARIVLDHKQDQILANMSTLQADINYNVEQQRRLDELNVERKLFERRVQILDGLRGGLPAERMFEVVDDAFDGNTWFRKWAFRRRGDLTDEVPDTVHTGYLIIVADPDKGEKEKAWRMATHMEIAGSAIDHTALAGFVERLLAHAEIADVKILRTGSRRESKREVVDFDIAVTVFSAYEA